MKWSPFRGWVHNLWVQNCDEHQTFHLTKYSEREYFKQFKWWLKREYKHQEQQRLARQNRQPY